jgi:phospholipid transport system substrate-binding protein
MKSNTAACGIVSVFVLLLSLSFAVPSNVWAADKQPAVQQVETFTNALLDSMKRAKELGLKGRYEALKPVVDKVFDLPTMTRFAVGPTWTSISAADQKALISAFERMTVANYADNFDAYDGETFVVDPTVIDRGADKLVATKLVASDQTETPFTYRMRESGGTWKVIDVFLNGYVSQLAARRSDFSSTIANGGPSALLVKINQLADDMLKSS